MIFVDILAQNVNVSHLSEQWFSVTLPGFLDSELGENVPEIKINLWGIFNESVNESSKSLRL